MTILQRQFINDMVANVKERILSKAKDIPKEWDGFELRLFISEHFKQVVMETEERSKRKREFFNHCWTNNLI